MCLVHVFGQESEEEIKAFEAANPELDPIRVRVDIALDECVYSFLLLEAKRRHITFEKMLADACRYAYINDMKSQSEYMAL